MFLNELKNYIYEIEQDKNLLNTLHYLDKEISDQNNNTDFIESNEELDSK